MSLHLPVPQPHTIAIIAFDWVREGKSKLSSRYRMATALLTGLYLQALQLAVAFRARDHDTGSPPPPPRSPRGPLVLLRAFASCGNP
jgi:hypothetical protein